MRNITNAIEKRDIGALAQMMGPDPRKVVNAQAERLVDSLFNNLLQLFPAARHTVLGTPSSEATAKRQWILAFAESGITTKEQLVAGMRRARAEPTDFWPSPGKFIAWCREGESQVFGLPDLDSVMKEFNTFNRTRDQYEAPELFPWSHPVMYWIVLDMRKAMLQYNQNYSETEKTAKNLLNKWNKKVSAGEQIPTPVIQLVDKEKNTNQSVAEKLDKDGRYRAAGNALVDRLRKAKGGAA